jgi:hypothetical protein
MSQEMRGEILNEAGPEQLLNNLVEIPLGLEGEASSVFLRVACRTARSGRSPSAGQPSLSHVPAGLVRSSGIARHKEP